MVEDFERCYRAVRSRDARFDGWFFTGVRSTGVYCRPSCPAMTPRRHNLRFFASAAAAQGAGLRACLRCRPDVTPGSPEWDARADVAGRAMRLIADGVVDRDGVGGLARRLAFSERHLHRRLVEEVGAGPLALARAQRAHTARLLIETTTLSFTEIAFAAGFGSLRQFNDTVRAIFARTPTALRRAAGGRAAGVAGAVSLRLPFRAPLDLGGLFAFLALRAVPGIEELREGAYRRTLRLAHGHGVAELSDGGGHVACVLRLADLRDLGSAVQRCRRLLDLDADPVAVAAHLAGDPLLAPLVASAPGRRVPGHVDGTELAARAVLGQQVSVAGARTLARRLVERLGDPLAIGDEGAGTGALTLLFPGADAIADADPAIFAMPRSRGAALVGVARAIAAGDLDLEPGADREAAVARLLALRGIGPWTASYVAMRALADPDAFLPTDLGVIHALRALGEPTGARAVTARAEAWRPWRSYAMQHLWATL